ncbi:hypothetical protein [Aliirhizobium smilacinae]|uniref:hypothetical protein n=1 Tax=Aliirhizobium smilacinae TaxID=1395944 RepID=UPI002678DFAE
MFPLRSIFSLPVFWIIAAIVPLVALLSIPISIPIGPMYWDTYLYLDAAQRIWMGQVPSVDFSTPVGPLPYYLFAAGLKLFENAQPLLLAQWCILPVAIPLFAPVLAETTRQSKAYAFALLVPFLVFATFPANVSAYHPFPTLDGFGIYNRHSVIFLYVLTSGLVFLKDGRRMAVLVAGAMLALFLTKITGFLVGGLFGLLALLSGRISLRYCILAVIIFLVPLAIAELTTGMVSAYLRDIAQLATMNEGSLLTRFLTVASLKLDVLLPVGVLALVLIWIDWTRADRSIRFFDHSFWWLSVVTAGGVIFETQNTGSQEFIFIWPVMLMIFERIRPLEQGPRMAVLALAAFCVIPTFTKVAHKTLRAAVVAPTYERLHLPEVRNMQQVSQRQEIIDRAIFLETHYENYAAAYADLSAHGQLPSWQYYSELDFQLYWIISANSLVESLKAFEAKNNVRLDSLMTLDFTNPFAWLLNRDATKHIQIGADPYRTVPPLTEETIRSVEETAAVLRPKCPLTTGRRMLEAHYQEALKGRTVVQIHPCWDLLLRPDILASNNLRPGLSPSLK